MNTKKINIIKSPFNLGYSNVSTNLFPDYIFKCGLENFLKKKNLKYSVTDCLQENNAFGNTLNSNSKLRNYDLASDYYQKLSTLVSNNTTTDSFPIIIGGDHSISIGSIAGLLDKQEKLNVLWLDAHPDFHTDQTTETQWIYGLPAAAVCGLCNGRFNKILNHKKVLPQNMVLFGCNFIDKGELENIKNNQVNLISLDNIIENGIGQSVDKAINILKQNNNPIHVSIDLDVIDEHHAPGVGEPSHGLLTYREIKYVFKKLYQTGLVNSLDIVEGDPTKDKDQKTGQLAVELIANILGFEYSEYESYMEKNRI